MWWFPYEKFKIDINYPPDQVKTRLEPLVESTKPFRFPTKHKDFQGEVKYDYFSITPIVDYRNTFVPLIEGSISKNSVVITMSPNHSALFFAIFVVLFAIIVGKSSFWNGLLVLFFCYIVVLVCYKTEASSVKETLTALLK